VNFETKLPKESTKPIEAVDKSLSILECFSNHDQELSLKQLSEKTGLYKSRILRLCGTLLTRGFLVRSKGATYSLGPTILRLGKIYERGNSIISMSIPILQDLTSRTGESTKLFGIQGTKRVCLARVKGHLPLSYTVEEGEVFELYAGSAGLILLAYSSMEFRDQVLGGRVLKKLTPNTIVERDRLEEEFAKIRARGYAISRGEMLVEVAGISAPVFDHDGERCAAMTISGPVYRFTDENCRQMVQPLLAAAHKLSQLMGYAG